jgi:serine protease Do
LHIPAVDAPGGVDNLADLIDPQNGLIGPLGIFVIELDKSIVESLTHLRSASGLVVAGTVDYTPAINADLAVGDVIRSINGVQVTKTKEFRTSLDGLNAGDPVVLEVERQGVLQFVSFEME